MFADSDTGRLPKWLGVLTAFVASTMWKNYERVWKRIFGSGEVTGSGITSEPKDLEHGEKQEMSEGIVTDVRSAHIDFYHL
jgi:hypothetical protein